MTAVLVNDFAPGQTEAFTLELEDDMDDVAFYRFCRRNDHLRFERNPDGTILIMPNTGGKTGIRNTKIVSRLDMWSESHDGKVFDSSTAFKLPNFATRSPDAAWVSDERWNELSDEEQERFPPIAPDFVVELMSASDHLKKAQEKMLEYIENGVRLGWLIQPSSETVFIYRADGTISKVNTFDQTLSGEDVLPNFEFPLRLLR
ncbi:Uma2 family endonuclease [Runella sp. SP2]|uniref:Uma2 family endonuclease n=1 Tax=Runella sp. SP2 TaxID=2268026 RepID=UPI000F093E3E|nr:Uma2 family endonuclease [Runella sp. SP2]AYQ35475.1 Uma2 family endonuclease [Runella sp. SP2]